jgi:hypothetical protein
MDGAGVMRGDLTAECTAMVTSVLDALSAPAGGGDLRTQPQRYHDALEEAMRRLLASGLLPKRAGQPVKALAHIHFTELLAMDKDSVLQDPWIADYRAPLGAEADHDRSRSGPAVRPDHDLAPRSSLRRAAALIAAVGTPLGRGGCMCGADG